MGQPLGAPALDEPLKWGQKKKEQSGPYILPNNKNFRPWKWRITWKTNADV